MASLGGDIERVGADGSNVLSSKAAEAALPRPVPALLAALAKQQAEQRAADAEDRAASSSSSDLIVPVRPKAAASAPEGSSASSSSSVAASAVATAAPSAASSSASSSTAFGSDFLTLMKLLADDRDRLRDNKTLITGDDELDAANAATAAGQTLSPKRPGAHLAAAASSFGGDHIRVDDSYGFTPDPFAPESRPAGEGTALDGDDDEADDPLNEEEDRARIRILGEEPEDESKRKSRSEESEEEEDEDGTAAADPDLITAPRRSGTRPSASSLRGSALESALFLSEEDAGASLESVPVEADYEYRAEQDKMSLLEFRAAQAAAAQAKAAASPNKKRGSAASESTALTTERTDGRLSAPPPSLVDRAASRLGADAAIAAAAVAAAASSGDAPTSAASVSSPPDEVESFSYRPDSFDPHADAETEEAQPAEAELRGREVDESKLPSTPKLQLSPKLSAASSSAGPALSAAARLMFRPVVMRPPTSSFLDADEDDEDDALGGVETLDLEQEPSTSVAILSVSSSSVTAASASIRPPTQATHGNFLDRSAQMGFEDNDDDDKLAPARGGSAAASSSSHAAASDVDDVSEEEGEWMTVEEAMASINDPTPAAAAAAPSYTPSAQSSVQRPRRMMPK